VRQDDSDAMIDVAQIYEAKKRNVKRCSERRFCPGKPPVGGIISDGRCEHRRELLR
jgi:hypothetical protein